MPMQTRLLRVLQGWEVLRVGATVPRKVDMRVIAATNEDLEKELERGSFRSDLYYRLKVAVLTLSPLRKSKADILPLAQGFLTFYGKRFHKKGRLSEELEHTLRGYAWPGNVRELENLIQGLLVTCKGGYIQASDLAGIRPEAPAPETAAAPFKLPAIEGRSLKSIMKEMESQVLEAGLRRYGSIGELARHFQMDRSIIFRKVRGLGVGAKPARRARKKRERTAEDERP